MRTTAGKLNWAPDYSRSLIGRQLKSSALSGNKICRDRSNTIPLEPGLTDRVSDSVNIHISLTTGAGVVSDEAAGGQPHYRHADDSRGRLDGLSILIVGGTSGLGLAATRACLREHANVTVVGRDDEDFARAAAEFDDGSQPPRC